MPQATSAQREPSMEEILASIRRIIEDSDSSKKHPSDGEVEAVSQPAAKAEVEAFRAELRSAPEPVARHVAPKPELPAERKPISLAEVQAEMRRALPAVEPKQPQEFVAPPGANAPTKHTYGEGLAVRDISPAREPAAPLRPVESDDRKPVSMADIQALLDKEPGTRPAVVEPGVEPGVEPMVGPVESPAAPVLEPWVARSPTPADAPPPALPPRASVVEPARPVPVPVQHVAPASATSGSDASKQSIISVQASKQVAAAFGELSEAFAASRQKSFDEMAEQMMRPMLQEWFDNNLPVLVERLVREEIERVARGG